MKEDSLLRALGQLDKSGPDASVERRVQHAARRDLARRSSLWARRGGLMVGVILLVVCGAYLLSVLATAASLYG